MMPFNDAEDVVDKDDLNTQKQLLSTEDIGVVKGSAKSKSSDVRVTQPFKSSSAPAQSTSIDIKLAQQPHQSRLQKPQSRLTLPLH
ncbi:hypothetical protein DPMN_003003 [Dreissena polymorpha]|uniref:Uncharacterized protein n=1 Tax=Dreissena polymorpha TaxID=45954 RepID=A0A9D4MPT1_DREPO|nr:hypothetical protein DPMN_003003 [Dreissena polymorpha]